MKPTYKNFTAQKSGGYTELPPVGAYVAEIQNVRFVEGENGKRSRIECMMEIAEGDYKGRYHEVFEDQRERFGNANYKGIYRIFCPLNDEDLDCRKRFEGTLWCVEQSNSNYTWDWDEKKLKGKKVGISVRKRLYTYNGKDRETTEIGQFETIEDVKAGKCKQMKDRDQREKDSGSADSTDGSEFTDVSKDVDVPWG